MNHDEPVRRLLGAIFAPRRERWLRKAAGWCYALGESGPPGWAGDGLDEMANWLFERRMARGKDNG